LGAGEAWAVTRTIGGPQSTDPDFGPKTGKRICKREEVSLTARAGA